MTPNPLSTERLDELAKLLLRRDPMSDMDCFDLGVMLEELRDHRALAQDNERLRDALHRIAAFNDELASERLAKTGSYAAFDESASVEIARRALNPGGSDAE